MALAVGATTPPAAAQHAPSPAEYLGYEPAAEARLPSLHDILGYFDALAGASSRVRVDTIGRSTLDAPIVAAVVTGEANFARLTELRAIQARLADPRRIEDEAERARLLERGRLVVVVTAGIHSTEVGGPLSAMRLAHRLATSPGVRESRIRDEAIVVIVPVVNPDGVDRVKAWYESTLGTPWLGSDPPEPYHHYAGHDLNRDWYAFTQPETRAVVERVLLPWAPQVHLDLHQQEADGARYFVPPWLDPVEPNVDPLLIAAAASLGTRTQWAMLEEGRTGVSVAARYDAWTPARAFVHYHGGVRILSETASARLAAPVDIAADELRPAAGIDPRESSWNHPVPWPGGRWDLADVVSYMTSGAMATIAIAASERVTWLRNFEQVGRRATEGWDAWPEAWLILPPRRVSDGFGAAGHAELFRILTTAGVEVERAPAPFTSEGRTLPAGTGIVRMRQPYAAFAQAMLAPQPYPPRRRFEGGPPLPPYDVTAHNLPLLLGVDAVPVYEDPPPAEPAPPPAAPSRRVVDLTDEPAVMVGLYRPWTGLPDEGWTRWMFDNYAVPYERLTNEDVARGARLRELSAVVLPSVEPRVLREGRGAGEVPPEYAGGLTDGAVENLRAFVDAGGTLVAMGASVDFAIEALDLPVSNLVRNLAPADFFAPGALVGLTVDTTTFVGRGVTVGTAAWLEDAAAFRLRDAEAGVVVIARYAAEPVVRSGWVVGGPWIAGRPAAVEIPFGAGRVVLFGFRPQYRGQSLATYPLLANALKRRR